MIGYRRATSPLVWCATLAALSCSESSSPRPVCTTTVDITVSSGTTPTFTWVPECRALSLLVKQAGASGNDMWLISAEGGIASGVVYGTLPPGAEQVAPAEPLLTGADYEVWLEREGVVGSTVAGMASFTP